MKFTAQLILRTEFILKNALNCLLRIGLLSSFFILCSRASLADPTSSQSQRQPGKPVELTLGQIPGFYPIHSSTLFSDQAPLSLFYPETLGPRGINVQNPTIRNMVNAAEKQGILYWIGYNTNFAQIFPLYRSAIGADPTEDLAAFGGISMGLGHLPTHDLSHLLFAMVAPRYEGLFDDAGNVINPQKMKKAHSEMTAIFVETESLASAWTSLHYLMDYMIWANDYLYQNGDGAAIDPEKFEKDIREMGTVFQFGRMNRRDFVRITEAQTAGVFIRHDSFAKTIYEATRNILDMVIKIPLKADPKLYLKRVQDQMPLLVDLPAEIDQLWNQRAKKMGLPSLHPKVRDAAVAIALKTIAGAAFAIETTYRPFSGARAFSMSSANFATGFLTPWSVEYANRFHWGLTPSEAFASLEKRKQQLIQNEFFNDEEPPANLIPETMILRNEIAELGRRLIEVKWLNRARLRENVKYNEDWKYQQTIAKTEKAIVQLISLHDVVFAAGTKNKPIKKSELDSWKISLLENVHQIEASLPLDQVIPSDYRNEFLDYSNYWRDMFAAVGSPRAGMEPSSSMKAFFNDEFIFERVKAILKWQSEHGPNSRPEAVDSYRARADDIAAFYIHEVYRAWSEHKISTDERNHALEVYDQRFSFGKLVGNPIAAKVAQLLKDPNYLQFLKDSQKNKFGIVHDTEPVDHLILKIQSSPRVYRKGTEAARGELLVAPTVTSQAYAPKDHSENHSGALFCERVVEP